MTRSSNDETAISDDTDVATTEDADDSHSDQTEIAHQHTNKNTDSSQDTDIQNGADVDADDDGQALAELRAQVEDTYDFGDFGPEDMAEMTLEEWEAAFDPDTWIVGKELLDRVETELKARVAIREIFGIVERTNEGGQDRVVAYSDKGYATVYADGSVEGEGTIRRDVEPTVALCSMDSYETMDPPADASLPEPREVVKGSGEFGNLMLQIVAAAQMIVGVGLFGAWLFIPTLETIAAPVTAVIFVLIGFFLFIVVANARLSDRFRVEEYRNRLQALETTSEPAVTSDETTATATATATAIETNHPDSDADSDPDPDPESNKETSGTDANTSGSPHTAVTDADVDINTNTNMNTNMSADSNSHNSSDESTDSV